MEVEEAVGIGYRGEEVVKETRQWRAVSHSTSSQKMIPSPKVRREGLMNALHMKEMLSAHSSNHEPHVKVLKLHTNPAKSNNPQQVITQTMN